MMEPRVTVGVPPADPAPTPHLAPTFSAGASVGQPPPLPPFFLWRRPARREGHPDTCPPSKERSGESGQSQRRRSTFAGTD